MSNSKRGGRGPTFHPFIFVLDFKMVHTMDVGMTGTIARCCLALCMQPIQMQVNSRLMIGALRWLPEIQDGRLDAHSQVPVSIVMHCPCYAFRCAAHLIIGAPRWLPEIQHGRLDVHSQVLLHVSRARTMF